MEVVESQGKFRQMFLVQSAIGCHDVHAQLKKLWNLSNNLDFKGNSFYPFPSPFRQYKLWKEHFRAWKDQRFSSRQPWQGQKLSILDILCIPEPGHYLALPKFKFCIKDSKICNTLFAKASKVFFHNNQYLS